MDTSEKIISNKIAQNEALTEADIEYLEQKKAIEDKYNTNTAANEVAIEEQEKAKKEQEVNEKIAEIEARREQEQLTFEEDIALQAERDEVQRAYELEKAEGDQAAIDEINQKYDEKEKERDKILADFKLGLAKKAFGEITKILGENTAAGKAAALASATINTYEGVTQVWKAESVLPEPAATIAKVANTAVVVASGLSAVKKIAGTKTPKPKAEKGALFNIGGKRHSQGGTTFTGEDGTQFEAEQGELIGVMNRNAASHFMAFNNVFPAGGSSAASSNYFESGGIVSRSIATPGVNTDELAAKIAEANQSLPAPRVAVEDIISEGNSYVQVREGANF